MHAIHHIWYCRQTIVKKSLRSLKENPLFRSIKHLNHLRVTQNKEIKKSLRIRFFFAGRREILTEIESKTERKNINENAIYHFSRDFGQTVMGWDFNRVVEWITLNKLLLVIFILPFWSERTFFFISVGKYLPEGCSNIEKIWINMSSGNSIQGRKLARLMNNKKKESIHQYCTQPINPCLVTAATFFFVLFIRIALWFDRWTKGNRFGFQNKCISEMKFKQFCSFFSEILCSTIVLIE